ncbi:MAG TPA: GNAT family N-acetyltransferase [Candidatus Aquilonibacter sp.]|nr:GNAT family N-acetyltransferase [Candidatus Aquilonibacter sp.]
MTSPQLMSQDQARAELIPLGETDLACISGFIATQSGRGKAAVEAHLRWFLLENPARRPEQPLGFGLRSSGELVGCILCSPQAFQYQGQRVLLIGSTSFYVDERYRGQGGRIFLQYSRLANRWPLFGTSANPDAAAVWKAAGAMPIPYSDGELFGILNWPPIAEEFAHRKTSNRFVSRLARSSSSKFVTQFHALRIGRPASNTLRRLTSALEAGELASCNSSEKLTAVRDEDYLRWRYFSARDSSVAAFAFHSGLCNRDILVTVNQRKRGYRSQINTLNVLDVSPEASADEWLKILGALLAHYSGSVDALVLRNQDLEQRKMLCEVGFHWRAFDAPTGWSLDRTNRLPAPDWYVVPADGDGLI